MKLKSHGQAPPPRTSLVHVVVKQARKVGLVCRFNSGYYNQYEYVWVDYSTEVFTRDFDFGFITSTHSKLSDRENNCRQYSVCGECSCVNGLIDNMKVGNYLAVKPIPISEPGTFTWTSISKDGLRKTENKLEVTAVTAVGCYTKGSEVNFRWRNGRWKESGSWTGVWEKRWKPSASNMYNTNVVPVTDDELIRSLRDVCGYSPWTINHVLEKCTKSFGDLANEAAKSIRSLDINSIAFIRDFVDFKKLIRSVANVADPESLKQWGQRLSSLYLGHHYGTRLTIKDTEKIAHAIDRIDLENAYQTMGASISENIQIFGREYTVERRLTAKVRNVSDEILHETLDVSSAIDQFVNRIKRVGYELDIAPSAANLWDLVPYSFVVDWFLPIGKNLENREDRSYMETLPVDSVFLSSKLTWTIDEIIPLSTTNLHTSLSCKYYERECTSDLPYPPMHIDTPKGFSGHWLEASAIILQNATRR